MASNLILALLTLYLATLASRVEAVPIFNGTRVEHLAPRGPHTYKYRLEDYFRVELKDPKVPGSCQKYEQKMRQSWDETIELLTLARDQSKLLTIEKPATLKKQEFADWIRIEQTFRAL